MNWLSFPVVICVAVDALLFAQGIFCASQRVSHLRWFGRITALLALLGLIGQLLLFSGTMLLTPEFGLIIIHGPLILFWLLIMGITIGSGLGLHAACLRVEYMRAQSQAAAAAQASPTASPPPRRRGGLPRRSADDQPARRWRLIVAGIIFGLLSIGQVVRFASWAGQYSLAEALDRMKNFGLLPALLPVPVNAADPTPLQIFAYDMRWPPLLIWLSACLISSGLIILRVEDRLWRWWFLSLIISGQGLRALPLASGPLSQSLWLATIPVAMLVNVVSAAGLAVGWLSRRRRLNRWVALGLMFLVAITGEALWLSQMSRFLLAPADLRPIEILIIFLGWTPLLLGLALIALRWQELSLRVQNFVRRYMLGQTSDLAIWPTPPEHLDMREMLLALSLAAVAVSLAFLFYDIAGIGPTIPLLSFFISWTLLAEAVTSGVLHRGVRWLHGYRARLVRRQAARSSDKSGAASAPAPAPPPAAAPEATRQDGTGAKGVLSNLISLKSLPGTVFKTLLLIVLLIAMSELANAGRTLVQPFTITVSGQAAPGAGGESAAAPSGTEQAISDRLINNLGALSQQLRPDILIPAPGSGTRVNFKFAATGGAGGLDAALARSNDLQVSEVKIPLNLFVAPIQGPMRKLLRVRTISGSFQDDGDGYTLLATSTDGETWRAKATDRDRAQAIISATEELAFNITATDPAFATLGMTRSWATFQLFRRGLDAWQEFEAEDSPQALNRAIQQFQTATESDHHFALAFYRLGLAFQRDGQHAAAADAFRSSVAANPKFAPAYNALAYTLYNFDDYDYSTRSAVLPAPTLPNQQARIDEARRGWQTIVLFPEAEVSSADRASAYYGLCLDTFREAASTRQYALPYFYCQQSEASYGQLSAALRADSRIKQAEAAVLNTLGFTIADLTTPTLHDNFLTLASARFAAPGDSTIQAATVGHAPEQHQWFCRVVPAPTGKGGLAPSSIDYALAAQRFFDQALALEPDDQEIRCNAASMAYALGNPERMDALAKDAAAHLSLAEKYRLLAKGVSLEGADANRQLLSACPRICLYSQALDEYQAAIDLDSSSIWALNGYAYTLWQWQFRRDVDSLPDGPSAATVKQAETYARQAVGLVEQRGTDSEKATVYATLGAIYLAEEKPDDAIAQIEQARLLAPLRPSYDEIRWELAQAYLDKAGRSQQGGWGLVTSACALHNQIQRNEEQFGFQPFSQSGLLTADCRAAGGTL
jgi:tetratricopeptide (TPR) repeat protein